MKQRLSQVLRGHGAADNTPIFYTCLEGCNLRNQADVRELTSLIERVKPVLVVIDAFADVMPGADENSVGHVLPVLNSLRRIAHAYHLAILLVHHTNRDGQYRGSSAIPGGVDLLLMVTSAEDSATITLQSKKTRDGRPFTLTARLESNISTDSLHLELVSDTADSRHVELTPDATDRQPLAPHLSLTTQQVVDYLRDHGPSLVASIITDPDGSKSETRRSALYDLVDRGVLTKVLGGGRGKPATYDVASREARA